MWFKQLQIFQLTDSFKQPLDSILKVLQPFAFTPCLPSMPQSFGWVSPVDEDIAPIAQILNGNVMLCMQVEERILPSIVITQELNKKIKKIQGDEDRKVRSKEKLSLKDELIITLLPRAFTKLTRIYGYIDTKNNWLVLGTTNEKKAEQFLSLFKKSISDNVNSFQVKKLTSTFTHWLKHQDYPTEFAIEKACVLQDPQQKNRVIRCQQQNLFAESIQTIIKEGCEVKQLALSWQDRIQFVLNDQFVLSGIKYQDEIISQASELEAETAQQQFNADFFIMATSLTGLLQDLLNLLLEEETVKQPLKEIA